jgi:hypothetical protein
MHQGVPHVCQYKSAHSYDGGLQGSTTRQPLSVRELNAEFATSSSGPWSQNPRRTTHQPPAAPSRPTLGGATPSPAHPTVDTRWRLIPAPGDPNCMLSSPGVIPSPLDGGSEGAAPSSMRAGTPGLLPALGHHNKMSHARKAKALREETLRKYRPACQPSEGFQTASTSLPPPPGQQKATGASEGPHTDNHPPDLACVSGFPRDSPSHIPGGQRPGGLQHLGTTQRTLHVAQRNQVRATSAFAPAPSHGGSNGSVWAGLLGLGPSGPGLGEQHPQISLPNRDASWATCVGQARMPNEDASCTTSLDRASMRDGIASRPSSFEQISIAGNATNRPSSLEQGIMADTNPSRPASLDQVSVPISESSWPTSLDQVRMPSKGSNRPTSVEVWLGLEAAHPAPNYVGSDRYSAKPESETLTAASQACTLPGGECQVSGRGPWARCSGSPAGDALEVHGSTPARRSGIWAPNPLPGRSVDVCAHALPQSRTSASSSAGVMPLRGGFASVGLGGKNQGSFGRGAGGLAKTAVRYSTHGPHMSQDPPEEWPATAASFVKPAAVANAPHGASSLEDAADVATGGALSSKPAAESGSVKGTAKRGRKRKGETVEEAGEGVGEGPPSEEGEGKPAKRKRAPRVKRADAAKATHSEAVVEGKGDVGAANQVWLSGRCGCDGSLCMLEISRVDFNVAANVVLCARVLCQLERPSVYL